MTSSTRIQQYMATNKMFYQWKRPWNKTYILEVFFGVWSEVDNSEYIFDIASAKYAFAWGRFIWKRFEV